MEQRTEFVMLASAPDANVRQLCRLFEIEPSTAYKWLGRYRAQGSPGLCEMSRRPKSSPHKTGADVEQAILALRRQHPAWGGKKIHARLKVMGTADVPASSTITDILRRHGLIAPEQAGKHTPFRRFEHDSPNDLWQMDFKGQFQLVQGGWCFPLTVVDDHSRFAIGLRACGNQKSLTVQAQMIEMFRRYGLPCRILTDNGSPWGCDGEHRYTSFSAWLLRLGIAVSHGRPYHPQTQGKDERFHRTLNVELLAGKSFRDQAHVQESFDAWRDVYNLQRPHEALGMDVPASRYRPSGRSYCETLPPIEYERGDVVRKVDKDGYVHYRSRVFKLSQAFAGYPVAVRPTRTDGTFDVYFCHQKIHQIDLRQDDHV